MASTRTRTRTPRGQGAALRGRLLDVTTQLIDEQGGTAGLSIRQITKRAGVSPMAFYLHFEDRESLLREVIRRGFERFLEVLLAAREAHPDPRGRLLAMGVAYLGFARREHAIYTVIFGPSWPGGEAPAPDAADCPADPDDPGELAFGALVEAVAACAPALEQPEVVALGLWTGLHGYADMTATRPHMAWPPDEAFARRLLDAWVPRGA